MSKYSLNKIERRYLNNTLITYYYQPLVKKEKKFKPIDIDGYRYKLDIETGEYNYYNRKDCELSKSASVKRSRIKLNEILDMNIFDWFVTLTFDKDRIDRTNENEVKRAYDKFIHNLSVQYPEMRYVAVPERHEDGCIHYHMVIGNMYPAELGLYNSGKVLCSWVTKASSKGKCSSEWFEKTKKFHELKDTDGQPVYTCRKFIYGFSDVTRIVNRAKCSSYVKKYIDKNFGSTAIFQKRFYYSKNCERPLIYKEILKTNISHLYPIQQAIINDSKFISSSEHNVDVEHNIIQCWISNTISDNIDNEVVTPLSNKSIVYKEIELKFGE